MQRDMVRRDWRSGRADPADPVHSTAAQRVSRPDSWFTTHDSRQSGGFTLIELLVVMAILGTLLALAVPRYFRSVERSKEAVLKQDLNVLRDAIDKHFADTGKYPEALEDLVQKKYLRKVPPDPITESAASWVVVPPADAAKGGVYDVSSGAPGKALDGTQYQEW